MASLRDRFNGERLREARERAGLRQADVAAGLTMRGVPAEQPVVSQWENGRQVPVVTALKTLADVLGVTVDDLLDPQADAAVAS